MPNFLKNNSHQTLFKTVGFEFPKNDPNSFEILICTHLTLYPWCHSHAMTGSDGSEVTYKLSGSECLACFPHPLGCTIHRHCWCYCQCMVFIVYSSILIMYYLIVRVVCLSCVAVNSYCFTTYLPALPSALLAVGWHLFPQWFLNHHSPLSQLQKLFPLQLSLLLPWQFSWFLSWPWIFINSQQWLLSFPLSLSLEKHNIVSIVHSNTKCLILWCT